MEISYGDPWVNRLVEDLRKRIKELEVENARLKAELAVR
jgi:hypothetical protein